jgi:hypothetical protein
MALLSVAIFFLFLFLSRLIRISSTITTAIPKMAKIHIRSINPIRCTLPSVKNLTHKPTITIVTINNIAETEMIIIHRPPKIRTTKWSMFLSNDQLTSAQASGVHFEYAFICRYFGNYVNHHKIVYMIFTLEDTFIY